MFGFIYISIMFDNEFYKNLKKPSFVPKAIVFKIVWPILYILMFCSFFTIISKESSFIKKISLILFIIQLFLNIIWSPVFFALKKIKRAFVIAVLMTVFAGITAYLFYKISKMAGLLFIPYIIWLIFACVLNYKFLKLNSEQ